MWGGGIEKSKDVMGSSVSQTEVLLLPPEAAAISGMQDRGNITREGLRNIAGED